MCQNEYLWNKGLINSFSDIMTVSATRLLFPGFLAQADNFFPQATNYFSETKATGKKLQRTMFSSTRIKQIVTSYPFPKRQILDPSEVKEFADDNFELDKHGRKSSKREENNVGKGEIARYEQFLLFTQCFQRTCTADT